MTEFQNEIKALNIKLKETSKELANTLVLIEQHNKQFDSRLENMEKTIDNVKKSLEVTLAQVNHSLTEMNEVMTIAGAARWRIAAEESLKLGQGQADALQGVVKNFSELSERNLVRLEQLTVETEKRVVKTLSKISLEQNEIIDEFKERVEKRVYEIEQVGEKAIQYLKKITIKFRVEQIVVAVLSAFITAFLMSLYINAELPWESFHHSKMEREVGKIVIQQKEAKEQEQKLP